MTNVQVIKDPKKAGAYLAKYFTKAVKDKRLFQKKAYFSSRGLLKPVDIYGGYEVDEFLESATLRETHRKVYKKVIYIKYESSTRKRPLSISRRKVF